VYDLMSRAIRDVMKLAGDGITLSAVEVDSIGARTVHVCVCVCALIHSYSYFRVSFFFHAHRLHWRQPAQNNQTRAKTIRD
jgi:hypothetical protein